MFCFERNKLRLSGRNEGKIKSYESCIDVRAWSHDIQTRNRYIRDWIKCDMPTCVIPVCTVASFLKTMTWRGRGRATSRCNPDCKSKVVLDSICTSCHAMKQCLRNNQEFEQYFDDEDFETAHWPCERCLDALKSIKLLWKVILEKIFKIAIPRSGDFETTCSSNESIKTITKAWQDEMVQQTLLIRNLRPFMKSRVNLNSTMNDMEQDSLLDKMKENSIHIQINTAYNSKNKSTDTDDISYRRNTVQGSYRSLRKKSSKSTSFRARTIDVGCDACYINEEELNMYRNNLEYLQQRFNVQCDETRRLKSENISLKLELRHMLRCKSVATAYKPMIISDNNLVAIPKPFESCCGQQENEPIKNVDSEIIITLKNCENDKFKKVSLLQVLHKTNGSYEDRMPDNFCNKQEDPITILSKVHDRFGAIVKREMKIASKKKLSSEKVKIEASYVSNPSCSRMESLSSLSDSLFMSTTNVM